MKTKITPRKETRSADLHIRIKPAILAKLKEIAKTRGKSQADVIEEWIEKERTV